MIRRRWREPDRLCLDQVANAIDAKVDLTPVSDAPAQAVRDAWAALLPGQPVPLLWERRYDDAEPCYD